MMTSYRPLEISQLDRGILHELILSKRVFGISQKNRSLKIRFLRASTKLIENAPFSFSLNINQQRAHLLLEPGLESFLTQRLQELGGIDSLPEEFRSSLMALCSREIINSLETLLQLPIALWDETQQDEVSGCKKDLYFEVINDREVVEAIGKITLSSELVEKIISLALTLPCMERPLLSECLLEGELVIYTTNLSLDEWGSLTAGSLLFLKEDSALVTGKGSFLLKHGKMMPLSFDQQHLQSLVLPLTKVIPSGFTPAHHLESSAKEKTDVFVSSEFLNGNILENTLAPVELALSVGTISLSIDEIINLASTSLLVSPMKVSHPIKILVQGEMVGTGELVKINHQYALFVTQA
ncbi:MAG: FliM/FliN family flagellar motor switch protein [Chthoniobacterales bacterium]